LLLFQCQTFPARHFLMQSIERKNKYHIYHYVINAEYGDDRRREVEQKILHAIPFLVTDLCVYSETTTTSTTMRVHCWARLVGWLAAALKAGLTFLTSISGWGPLSLHSWRCFLSHTQTAILQTQIEFRKQWKTSSWKLFFGIKQAIIENNYGVVLYEKKSDVKKRAGASVHFWGMKPLPNHTRK